MSGEPLHVETDRLRASRDLQTRMADLASELACGVRGAATAGDAFGKLGGDAEASYRAWVEKEATGLEELTRMLSDVAAGLEFCAEQYDGVDTYNAEEMTGLQGRLP
ncbi:type VII secretion target [Actinoplanes awajinensis]|uniref:Uncharacterized protein n=1 Tax=Actinoplanes awajinensis subsp. mycoplanecinus TaxID=135947 RepID=A0A0X3V742_9ACTN|nr:type VII secretion target [Actinoplanes awajinensis]KUL40629.1 hypothetical protein ADL15_06480 [Actinoplanes awajinensis subsp. mycoplanecinus]